VEKRELEQENQDEQNKKLAFFVLSSNPNLPPAFKAKFAIMSKNTHFARNVSVVIDDVLKFGIQLNLPESQVKTSIIEDKEEVKNMPLITKSISDLANEFENAEVNCDLNGPPSKISRVPNKETLFFNKKKLMFRILSDFANEIIVNYKKGRVTTLCDKDIEILNKSIKDEDFVLENEGLIKKCYDKIFPKKLRESRIANMDCDLNGPPSEIVKFSAKGRRLSTFARTAIINHLSKNNGFGIVDENIEILNKSVKDEDFALENEDIITKCYNESFPEHLRHQEIRAVGKKIGLEANVNLAKTILKLNPDLDEDIKKSLLEMTIDKEKSKNLPTVIDDLLLRNDKAKICESAFPKTISTLKDNKKETDRKNEQEKHLKSKKIGMIKSIINKIRRRFQKRKIDYLIKKTNESKKNHDKMVNECIKNMSCQELLEEFRKWFTIQENRVPKREKKK